MAQYTSETSRLGLLTEEQRTQLDLQIRYHLDGPPHEQIQLCEPIALKLSIGHGVTRPMSSKLLAQWLWSNPTQYRGGRVLDMGTGSGIQGVTCALGGAASVLLSDVTKPAVTCATTNASHLGIVDRTDVIQSDLFDSIPKGDEFDLIVFAQPYFEGEPLEEYEFTKGMLDPGTLLRSFFRRARAFLKIGGSVAMMQWPFAGGTNDPTVVGPAHGFAVESIVPCRDEGGVQAGEFNVVLLR